MAYPVALQRRRAALRQDVLGVGLNGFHANEECLRDLAVVGVKKSDHLV